MKFEKFSIRRSLKLLEVFDADSVDLRTICYLLVTR